MGSSVKSGKRELQIVGWREWVQLPDVGILGVKAKVDTGARTSCLHAFDVAITRRRGQDHVSFSVHPLQDDTGEALRMELPLLEHRWVKSSNGKRELRPVVETVLKVGEACWPIQITLTSRDMMGFRMLLGREALRRRLVVDPGRSFLVPHPMRKVRTRKPTLA